MRCLAALKSGAGVAAWKQRSVDFIAPCRRHISRNRRPCDPNRLGRLIVLRAVLRTPAFSAGPVGWGLDAVACLAPYLIEYMPIRWRNREELVMPINWADIAWMQLGLLAGLVFVASVIGNSLTRNAFVGAVITVIIFGAFYIFWDYYPHGLMSDVRFPNYYKR
jgi:hypothetical protein